MSSLPRALVAGLWLLSLPVWAATVTLTSPSNGQVFSAPASISLKASTSGSGIRKVEFYRGTTLIGSDSTSPYSLTWSNVAAGSYSLTAKAKNSSGTVVATSGAVAIVVNAAPAVSLTRPTANQGFATGSSIVLAADAADSDGSVSKVDFYRGTTLIGTATTAPYTVTWSNAPAGSYSLTAKATDNRALSKTSTAVAIVVAAPPTVTLTAPLANQVHAAPATVTLSANASPGSGGTLARVEFFQGSTLIGSATSAPYSFIWSNVPAGSFSLTAKATDNRNIGTTSAVVPIGVNAAGPAKGMYFIHPDHLGTPRVITNDAGQTVWRWDQDEPFGDTLANADPNATGSNFPFNLRFPGQYFDSETGTHYNYYRDYDPATGRYVQSDPIGLSGGINTYSYVGGNPLSFVDPTGLVRQLDPNGAECRQLKKKIQDKKADINKRICEVKDNRLKLPYYPPYPNSLPRMSVQGHEGIIQDLKDSLADDEALYAEKCGGGGGGSAPAPDSIAAKDAAAAAAGAGAAYWIISETLRVLFPPRNLIPVP